MSEIRLFDILMVYLDKDWALINKLCAILYKSICLEGVGKVSICSDLLDIHDGHTRGGGKLDFFELAMERSNYAFLFFGDEPVDSWTKVYQDMVQMTAIMKGEIKCVPIKLRLDTVIPTRFQIYQTIELTHLLRRKSLDTFDVDTFTADQLDQRILNTITKSLTVGRSKRLQRASVDASAYNSQYAFTQIWTQESAISSPPTLQTTCSATSGSTTTQCVAYALTLQKNFAFLTNQVDVEDSGLIIYLYSDGVLNDRERAKVMNSGTIFEKNEELLCLLLKKSEREFKMFLCALIHSGQKHISDKLQEAWERQKATSELSDV